MSGHWAPKPLVTADPAGLFPVDDSYEVVKKGLTPMERQRRLDGTPHTKTGRTALRPEGPTLYLGSERLSKGVKDSADCADPKDRKNPKPALDADDVIKAFLKSNVEC
jgi:hypothetical protein